MVSYQHCQLPACNTVHHLKHCDRSSVVAGANAFALDTRSKRQWESKPMSIETADAFKQACKDYGFAPESILPHGSYLINLASAKPELLIKSYTAFVNELKRCEMLGIRSDTPY